MPHIKTLLLVTLSMLATCGCVGAEGVAGEGI